MTEFCIFSVFQLQWICEKGLSVGHCKINTLGNPSVGELGACVLLLHRNSICRATAVFYFTDLHVS